MLEIDPKLLGITVVVFLVMIYLLNVILYKPILSFVDSRNESIANEEKELSKYGKDTKKYEEECAAILASARDEVSKLKAAAIQSANELSKSKIDAERTRLEADYKEFEAGLKTEQEALKVALSDNLPIIKTEIKSVLSKL
ncbi:MAG: F0F1 ATP synthase subunit B' [Campylobacter sp.]|uniref:F0F1 ATP synthase subunit B family protein n=1 Tax=Campylobacter sp. TaxID=205 RepID=UPI002AA6967F|nr:F0F1 ATP synthase subunit B' [Campylobacter sp.]MCI6344119.1 F0F1 ATP synthase subunit B' [Campylobacter sp.]MDD6162350.1 F0F1 ATP synthase subunit B' [Campylobacteraceae bacterium]